MKVKCTKTFELCYFEEGKPAEPIELTGEVIEEGYEYEAFDSGTCYILQDDPYRWFVTHDDGFFDEHFEVVQDDRT